MTSDVSEVQIPVSVLIERLEFIGRCSNEGVLVRETCAAAAKLLSAQPAVLAVPGWRPIESAPKDGRLILLNFGTKGVRAVSWDSPWADPVTEENGIWCVDDDKHGPYPMRGYNYNCPTAPTHWLPLPAAPAIHEGGEHA